MARIDTATLSGQSTRANTRLFRHQADLAGILMGVGLGGFVDGIVLHQILQWHNMVSNWLPPTTMEAMRVNMGLGWSFPCFRLVSNVGRRLFSVGAAYRREEIPSLQSFVGQLILGWGLFNLIEGVINHQLLGVHYVRQVSNYTVYNRSAVGLTGIDVVYVAKKRISPIYLLDALAEIVLIGLWSNYFKR